MSAPGVRDNLNMRGWFVVEADGAHLNGTTKFRCPEDTSWWVDGSCGGSLSMLCAWDQSRATHHRGDWRWWNFHACMMQNQTQIPRNAGVCATKARLPTLELQTCIQGERGQSLLNESLHAIQNLPYPLMFTPTLYIDGAIYSGIDYLGAVCDRIKLLKRGKNLPAGCLP